MPRKPFFELLDMKAELPRGNDGIWSVILQLDAAGPWTATDVVNRTNLNPGSPRGLVNRLRAAGYVRQVDTRTTLGRNPQQAPLYRLTSRPAEVPRLRQDGTALPEPLIERMWRAIRMAKEFTPHELGSLIAGGGEPPNGNSVRSYCDRLTRAGVLSRSTRSGEEPRYRLVRNLGPKAPKILATKIVFDPNGRAVIGNGEAREVQP